MLERAGCADHRVVSNRRLTVDHDELHAKVEHIDFFSTTVRAFKLASLEDRCEDYGQLATYKGGLEGAPVRFVLDDHHAFELGRPERVCGNTAAMLEETRYARFFDVAGDRRQHFGPFDCADTMAMPTSDDEGGAACC
jgi:hypothetical protein